MNVQRVTILILIAVIVPIGILGAFELIAGPVVGVSTILAAVIGGGIILYRAPSRGNDGAPLSQEKRLEHAQLVRATRERERAFYAMTSLLSSTLDYQKVLEQVLSVGELVAQKEDSNSRVVAAALLIQGDKGQLHVANQRGLAQRDTQVTVAGQEGVLGLALRQADPVFAGQASRDPELQYFSSFYECKSVLAVPLQAGFDYYGVLVFGSTQTNAFSEDYIDFLKSIGTQATIALQNAVLYRSITEEKERIVEVEEDARKKLARDLHDGPTQSIAAIAMRLNYIRRIVGENQQQALGELGKVEDLARRTTKEIRHMLFTLRPLILETQGLNAALGQLSEKLRETHDLNILLEVQPGSERLLDSHAQGVAFYIIEEAINNARKHAKAEHIWVRLHQRDTFMVIEIEDDGVGFDQKAVAGNYDTRGSLGMVNMRERAELMEGTLHIASTVGSGTQITILVPVKVRNADSLAPSTAPQIKPINVSAQGAFRKTLAPETRLDIPHANKRSPSS